MDLVADIAASDRAIRGGGTTDAAWLPWLASLRVPLLAEALRAPHVSRLVIVAPHPDDEVLACGGWIAEHARGGGAVVVLAVTDGEASHAGDPSRERRLASTRRLESERGLVRLGFRLDGSSSDLVRLGLPDSHVARHAGTIERALRRLLRPGDVVVTTWRLDGHPDHEATGTEAVRACAGTGIPCIEAPVWMWHWSTPGDPRVPWQRLRALPLSASALSSKTRALGEHASQLAPRTAEGPVLCESIVARASRDVEYFFV